MIFVPKDVVLLPEMSAAFPDRWTAMNVFARTCVGLSGEAIALLGTLPAGFSGPGERRYRCWDIEKFSNEDGLTADPSRYQRDPREWRERSLPHGELVAWLKRHFILIDDEAAYAAHFADKRNLLDGERFGNFHQQHGQHMLLQRRVDPARWWMEQKFTPDGGQVRKDNLYGAVQASFLEGFFANRLRPGMRALDVGCGNGVYASMMAGCGAEVLGIDPSEDYLRVARQNGGPRLTYERMSIGEPGGLAAIPDASMDWVFMSDALLFYFRPFYPGQKADIQVLLRDLRRVLRPGGTFVSMEPHTAFYLAPWLGEVTRPFTIVSEYLHKWFGVVPPLSWFVREFAKAGFAMRDLHETGPAEYFREQDARGYYFAREFPLWQVIELGAWR